jgi:predicted transglutaminase-like cysteine proteinase
MSILSQVHALARVIAACCLLGFTGGAAAQSATSQSTGASLARPVVVASLAPETDVALHAPAVQGPFGLASTHAGAMAAKWRGLQPALHLEARTLELCRANREFCTPAAARFLAIVDSARARTGRARIGEINRAINLAIRPVSDLARYNTPDVWTTPLMTFASGAGDCEDYAIAKYVALREAGMDARDLRLTIVHDRSTNQDHAVTAARIDGRWLILDNRRMVLLTDTQAGNLVPLVALDAEEGESPRLVAKAT